MRLSRRQNVRRGVIAVGVLLAIAVLWFGWIRLTATSRALRVMEIQARDVPPPEANPTDTLRIVSFNIAHGRGMATSNHDGGNAAERERRLDAIAALIRRQEAQIVVLNEVDFDCTWSNHADQARLIAERAGYPHVIQQMNLDTGLPGYRVRIGNAVLSRWPIQAADRLSLPSPSTWESLVAGQKNTAICRIDWPGRGPFTLLPIHLEHRYESVRLASVKAIAEAVDISGPVVLAGDFNSTLPDWKAGEPDVHGDTALSWLLDHGFERDMLIKPLFDRFTFNTSRPDRVIDWVLASKPLRLIDTQAITTETSDHRPIVVEIHWPADSAASR